jgi:hypothetical protein
MSFDDENLLVTSHRQSAALAPFVCIPFFIFLMASFFVVARITRDDELALWPDDGFYVSVETLLTFMKLIIALLKLEVKRYVVICLILFRNSMIRKRNIEFGRRCAWAFCAR